MAGQNDYFSFSKRERTGAITLIILIFLVFLIPRFIPAPKSSVDSKAFAAISKQLDTLMKDSFDTRQIHPGAELNDDRAELYHYSEVQKDDLFEFDPNTLSIDGWKKLGVSNKTITTIQKYISKGGHFKRPEDIGRIYGLRKDQYTRLLPFVRIKASDEQKHQSNREHFKPPLFKKENKPPIVDINVADTTMLIALPGIGSKLASRILNFRNRLGGFYSIEQVRETYGLPDSTFILIKSYLQCDASRIQRININTADAASLKNHPYIKWNIANAIVNYRLQHGRFRSVDELSNIEIISSELVDRLRPYLML